MGVIGHFEFNGLTEDYPHFIETGTGQGASLAYALNFPFKTVQSVDIDGTMHGRAEKMFEGEKNLKLWRGHGPAMLPEMLARIPQDEGIVYWLDSHCPGLWYGVSPLIADKETRLPLEQEMQIIKELRRGAKRDLLLIDDARIYLEGEFAHGNLTAAHHTLEDHERNIDFIYKLFSDTHTIRIDYAEEGYIIVEPIGRERNLTKSVIRELIDRTRCYMEIDRRDMAKLYYERIMEITDPPVSGADKIARGEACSFMAKEALLQGKNGTALDWYYAAISADPFCVEYRHDMIVRGLLSMGWKSFAGNEVYRLVQMFPQNPISWRAYTTVHKEMGNRKEASHGCDMLLQLAPDNVEALRTVAAFYTECGDHDQAIELYRKVIELAPRLKAEALHDIALCRDRQGYHEEALLLFVEVQSLGTFADEALLGWNTGWSLLTLGEYRKGWEEIQKREGLRTTLFGLGHIARRFRRPIWTLNTPASRVHVHGEQGFGDILSLSRWVPEIKKLGHDVRFEMPHVMVEMFRDSFPDVTIVRRSLDYPGAIGIDDFDYHIPLMGLPYVFGCTVDTIPWYGPYLKANPERVAKIDRGDPSKKRIGLLWSSGARDGIWFQEYASRKSMPERHRDAFDRPEINERVTWRVFNFEQEPMSFADSAAELASLDLLITVDTALGHLAGGMGVPTWLMMHANGSWHYMAGGRDERWQKKSPWYPNTRLFRQDTHHHWDDVLDEIRAELMNFLWH